VPEKNNSFYRFHSDEYLKSESTGACQTTAYTLKQAYAIGLVDFDALLMQLSLYVP